MALSKEEILDAIASMSVLEVSELIKMMEEKFGFFFSRSSSATGRGSNSNSSCSSGNTEFFFHHFDEFGKKSALTRFRLLRLSVN